MKEETLKNVKKMYEEVNKKIRNYNKKNERLLALQNKKAVTKYLKLRGINEVKEKNELKISEIYQNYLVEEEDSNHIYIYACYNYEDEEKTSHEYINIETGKTTVVLDNDYEEFEKNNTIIHLDDDLDFLQIHDDYYPEILEDFLLDAINNGQEHAKKYIMHYDIENKNVD